MSQITHFLSQYFLPRKLLARNFLDKFQFWRNLKPFGPHDLYPFMPLYHHLNMSLKSVRIHIVNVSFLGDWPVLQFLGERLRGQVGRQCYFLLSGLILCRFLLQKVPQFYFFSQVKISIRLFSGVSFYYTRCQCLGWWWWRFFHSKRI